MNTQLKDDGSDCDQGAVDIFLRAHTIMLQEHTARRMQLCGLERRSRSSDHRSTAASASGLAGFGQPLTRAVQP